MIPNEPPIDSFRGYTSGKKIEFSLEVRRSVFELATRSLLYCTARRRSKVRLKMAAEGGRAISGDFGRPLEIFGHNFLDES
jgi:hypothetical protein